jgi:hypothetical protein
MKFSWVACLCIHGAMPWSHRPASSLSSSSRRNDDPDHGGITCPTRGKSNRDGVNPNLKMKRGMRGERGVNEGKERLKEPARPSDVSGSLR